MTSESNNSKVALIKWEIKPTFLQIKPDISNILLKRCLNHCKNSKHHSISKTKPSFSPMSTESSLLKESSKKSYNLLTPKILPNNKSKWSIEYSTQPKTKRKLSKIYKNTKSISKKIWTSSKNITKRPIKKWISITLSTKHKIITSLLNAISERNKPAKRNVFFMNLSTPSKIHNSS